MKEVIKDLGCNYPDIVTDRAIEIAKAMEKKATKHKKGIRVDEIEAEQVRKEEARADRAEALADKPTMIPNTGKDIMTNIKEK